MGMIEICGSGTVDCYLLPLLLGALVLVCGLVLGKYLVRKIKP